MADFCTKCSLEMFGEEIAPDIDVQKEFETLDPGMCMSGYLCEGCGLVAIAKTEDGNLQVARITFDENSDDQGKSAWEEY